MTLNLTLTDSAQRTDITPLISTAKLSKTFSNAGTQSHVLKNLDLTIAPGRFTVIMGPSGAGKSTLLYALSGMDRPTLGTITFAGTEISRFGEDRLARFRRSHCGFVFQQIHLLDALTVMDNVLAVGLLGGERRSVVVARARELFDFVGLTPADTAKFPSMLSGGEAQRVGLVRSLISRPSVVFADEPTGQLNSEYARLVLDLLTRFHKGGQTVVMVTHDPRTAARGDDIWYLRDGTIQGRLALEPYDADDDARAATVGTFLTEMGW